MNQHQATRDEQLFFRLEMREERLLLWKSRELRKKFLGLLYGLYGLSSTYGQSILRPVVAFVAFLILFAGLYAMSSPADAIPWLPGITSFDCEATARWMTYSVVSSLPLGGLDAASKELREALEISVGPGHAFALAIHKILSLLALFLIGLGLRNLFKMK
jgi:hypothetical protein